MTIRNHDRSFLFVAVVLILCLLAFNTFSTLSFTSNLRGGFQATDSSRVITNVSYTAPAENDDDDTPYPFDASTFDAFDTTAVKCRLEMENMLNDQVAQLIDHPPYPMLDWIWELQDRTTNRPYYQGYFFVRHHVDAPKDWMTYARQVESWQWMWSDQFGNTYAIPPKNIEISCNFWTRIYFRIDPPQLPSAQHGPIKPQSMWPEGVDMEVMKEQFHNIRKPPVYHVAPYIQCNKEEVKNHPAPLPSLLSFPSSSLPATEAATTSLTTTTTQKPLKIGACVARFFDQSDLLPEWITYHKLLGVDHFWVFVGEDFDNLAGRGLPQHEPYVTYIPNNLYKWRQTDYHGYRDLFQTMANNECLYYAKQHDFDWVMTTDLDEYLSVRDPTISHPSFHDIDNDNSDNAMTTAPLPPLKQYLAKYNDQTKDLGQLMLYGAGWGRNKDLEEDTSKFRLTIDFTYRTNRKYGNRKGDDRRAYGGRQKALFNVHVARMLSIHEMDWEIPSNGRTVEAPEDELELNHYRSPMVGFFFGAPGDLVSYPEEVRDKYSTKVATILEHKGWSFPNYTKHSTLGLDNFSNARL